MCDNSLAALGSIAHLADVSPGSPALLEPGGVTLSYREFWASINAVTDRLQEAGVAIGERVAVLLPQGALQVITVAGVLNRHVCLPLQSKTTVIETETSLRKMSASALIVSSEYLPEAEAALAVGLTVLVAHDGEAPTKWQIRVANSPRRKPAPRSQAILYLVTSATMGSSKMVPLTANNLNAGIAATCESALLKASDRLLLMVPLCHRLGLESAFAQFLAGGSVITTRGFDPVDYLSWLNDLRPTWYACAPTVHQAALNQLRLSKPIEPGSLRLLQSAGAPLPIDTRQSLEEILQVPVLNGYGATETHYIAIESLPYRGHVPLAAGRSCGLEIGIMDDAGHLLPTDAPGEIVARGPAVFHGYLGEPEANLASFQDGWFKTGDLGHLDEDGNLYVTGRLKEMINRGGEKISPFEVECALGLHPAVLEITAFSISHPTLGEDIACAVVLRSDYASVSALDLRRFAAERLASYKVPHRILFVDQIPRGELGKPQRWLLSEQLKTHRTAPTDSDQEFLRKLSSDRRDVLLRLRDFWAGILDRVDIDFEDNFFDAGGDSLAAIQMLAAVDEFFRSQTAASAADFLDNPTLFHLSEMVGKPLRISLDRDSSNEMQLFPIRQSNTNLRMYCVPAEQEEGLYFRGLARHLQDEIDLDIVRRSKYIDRDRLFTFETDGKDMADAIRHSQPNGPYLLAGFCYGGIIAVEAARHLSRNGQDVQLVLFDAHMPGAPSLYGYIKILIKRASHAWGSGHVTDTSGLDSSAHSLFSKLRWTKYNLVALARRITWQAITLARPLVTSLRKFRPFTALVRWVQTDYFPIYRAAPVNVPILHFLTADTGDDCEGTARFGWRKVARSGITEENLPFDHHNIFHESNLPGIAQKILEFCSVERELSEVSAENDD